MKKSYPFFLLTVVFVLSMLNLSSAKTSADASIKWTTIEQALSEAKSSNKKFILVDLYTDWCGWCKKMDEGAFSEAGVISMINSSFVPVKFNAEVPSPVTFNGKTYTFNKSGQRGANQLALDLGSTGGKLGYPTLVVLDANGNKLRSFPGYKDVETMAAILKYFESGSYKAMDFQQFQSGQ
jgi:thioredoxin-related protein